MRLAAGVRKPALLEAGCPLGMVPEAVRPPELMAVVEPFRVTATLVARLLWDRSRPPGSRCRRFWRNRSISPE